MQLSSVVPAGRLALHWYGQNSYAVKSPGGVLILVDPYFPHERPAAQFIHPQPPVEEADLALDAVLLTHDHGDHAHPETLRRIADSNSQTLFIGPADVAQSMIKDRIVGEDRFATVVAGGQHRVGDLSIYAVYTKPPAGDPASGISVDPAIHLGYVIACASVRLFITGDCIRTFVELDELVEPVKALAPQIGLITTHPTEGEFPLFAGSLEMARRLGLRIAFPSHYDCFVDRTFDPREWAAYFEGSGIEARIMAYNSCVYVP